MMEEPPPEKSPLTGLERSEQNLPEFLLLARGKERRIVEKARRAVARVKEVIEKAAPYPADD